MRETLAISLAQLATRIGSLEPTSKGDVFITGVAQDHRRVQPGDIFVAGSGINSHGIDYAPLAIAAGAVAILTNVPSMEFSVPALLVDDPKSHVGQVCLAVYGAPELKLFAVTGTNGKTSTVTYLRRLLEALGVRTAMSGSTGFEPSSFSSSSGLTTPELDVLFRELHTWSEIGFEAAVIEVSAHALTRHRVDGLLFEVAGFTNLTQDHLDEFGNMENYFEAKRLLFTPAFSKKAVITVDDHFGERLAAELPIDGWPLTFEGSRYAADNQHGFMQAPESGLRLRSPDFGAITASVDVGPLMARNLGLALSMLLAAGHSAQDLSSALERIDFAIPGRMQQVLGGKPGSPSVFLDYAHTPAAISAAIGELRLRGFDRVSIVFSASGDRDHTKRADMAQAAASADQLVVSDFHPRSEDPESIRQELMSAIRSVSHKVSEIAEPSAAIRYAVLQSQSGAAVIWCGPGSLRYREVAGEKIPFDPIAAATAALEEWN